MSAQILTQGFLLLMQNNCVCTISRVALAGIMVLALLNCKQIQKQEAVAEISDGNNL